MFDLNEELVIESFRVPWLIWIQLIVTILLVIVLFCGFSIFSADLSSYPTCGSAPSSSFTDNCSLEKAPLPCENSSSSQVEGSRCTEREGADSQERELSTAKDVVVCRPSGEALHPCTYFGLAKQAILKCLGLDSSPERARERRRIYDD